MRLLGSDYGDHYLEVIGVDLQRVRCEITKQEHDFLDRFTERRSVTKPNTNEGERA